MPLPISISSASSLTEVSLSHWGDAELWSSFLLSQGAPSPMAGGLGGMIPFILVIGVFYVLIIGPSRKQDKQRQERLNNLKVGDEVVLNGGILGKIHAVKDEGILEVQVSEKTRLRVIRGEVSDLYENYRARQQNPRASAKSAKPAANEPAKTGSDTSAATTKES